MICHLTIYSFLQSQKEVAMIAEMIHIASLIHDDVIDQAELRRGKPSANVLWNQKKVSPNLYFIGYSQLCTIYHNFLLSKV